MQKEWTDEYIIVENNVIEHITSLVGAFFVVFAYNFVRSTKQITSNFR